MTDECGVCIGSYDGDEAQFYIERMRRARKPHVCYECEATIQPGQTYELVEGRWDGAFARYKFCSLCSEIGKAFTCGDGRTFGVLWDDIREYVFPEMKAGCINKLDTAAAKQCLMDRWREWLGMHP